MRRRGRCERFGATLAADDGTAPAGRRAALRFLSPPLAPTTSRSAQQPDHGTYAAHVYLSTATPPPVPVTEYDFYSFSLADGETATLAIQGDAAGLVDWT